MTIDSATVAVGWIVVGGRGEEEEEEEEPGTRRWEDCFTDELIILKGSNRFLIFGKYMDD